jgi:hypothetical protein
VSDSRRKVAVVGFVIIGLLVPAFGIAVAWKGCGHGAIAGKIEVTGSSAGAWSTTIASCHTGAADGFRGVTLVGHGARDATAKARVEIAPLDGPTVTLWSPDGKGPLVVTKKDCAALAAELRGVGERDDESPAAFDGNVAGTCPLPGGGTVTIDAWWRDCRD